MDFCTCQYGKRRGGQTTPRPVRKPNQSRIFHVCVPRFCRIFLVFLFPLLLLLLFFYVIVVAVALCFVRQSNHPRTAVVSLTVCAIRVCVCVCGCCLYLYSNHQTFARVSCTRTTFKCDRVCVRVCACVCVGNKFAKAKRKWLVCPARGSGVAKGWQGVAVGGNFHFS